MDSEIWKTLVYFHEGIPESDHLTSWFPKGGLLVLDDLMAEGGEDKELLDLFTKHSHQNITVLYLCQDMFPPGKYAKSISRNAHSLQESKRSIRHEGFTASSLSHLLARCDGCVSKSDWTTIRVHDTEFTSRQWWQNTCVKSPHDARRIPTLLLRKRKDVWSLTRK